MSESDRPARFWTARVQLPAGSFAFIVLNLADLVLTYMILTHQDTWGYETNPVARYWHGLWGLPGLVFMKFNLVAIVLVICQMLHKYRPRLARRLLMLCCIIVGVVVCYGLAMLLTYEIVSGQLGGTATIPVPG